MATSLEIAKQQSLLKREIDDISENTVVALILKRTGLLVQFATRQSKPIPWFISSILLAILAFAPQTIAAFILKDQNQIIGKGLFWSTAVLLILLVIPMCYLISKYILAIARDTVIDAILDKDDLTDFRDFLLSITTVRKTLFRALILSLVWLLVAVPIFSLLNRGFIGLSYSFDIWIFGFVAIGIGTHYLGWFMRFPDRVKNYRFNLYQLNPSKSEVIFQLSRIFSRPFWVTAVYLAVCTFMGRLFEIFNWVNLIIVIVFWTPLLMQFINSQSAINKIISSAKWITLNELQEEIQKRSKKNQKSPEDIETINKLMDLHERVYSSSNIKLTANNIIGVVNQLLLPLIAFLISNYESVLEFFQ